MSFVCPDCQVENRTNAKFCRKCGRSRDELERRKPSVSGAARDDGNDVPAVTASSPASSFASGSASGSTSGSTSGPASPAVGLSPVPAPLPGDAEPTSPGDGDSNSLPGSRPPAPDSSAPAGCEAQDLPVPSLSQRVDVSSPQCPSCWTSLRATDKFCCWCGAPQPNRVLPFFKLCLDCNTQLPERANFCYSCGVCVANSHRLNVKPPLELFRDEESEFFPRFDA